MGEVRATRHSRFSRLSLKMCCLSSLGAAVGVEGVWRGTGGAKSRSIERRDLSVTDGKNRAIPGTAKCFKMRIIEEAAWTRLGLLWISLLFPPPPVACRSDASITTRAKTFLKRPLRRLLLPVRTDAPGTTSRRFFTVNNQQEKEAGAVSSSAL